MTSDRFSTVNVRSPADLLALVPYLLRFHPAAPSTVIIAVTGTHLLVGAHIDAAEVDTRDALTHVAGIAARDGATGVFIIGYGTPDQVTPAVDLAETVFAAHGLPVLDALRVTDGRFCSYHGDERPDTPLDPTNPTATWAVVAGHTAAPNRAALLAQLAPVKGAARDAMRDATERAATRLTSLVHANPTTTEPRPDAVLGAGSDAIEAAIATHHHRQRLSDDDAAWLIALLTYLPVRDLALQKTFQDTSLIGLWTDLTRRADPLLSAAPATLLGFAAWRNGDGTRAAIALQRALTADPGYHLAELLDQTLRLGVSPSAANHLLD